MTRWSSRWLTLLCFTLLSTVWAANKNLIPTSASSSFPQCGLSCSVLTSAQDSCTASADQSTWFSCFCQSALLTSLKTSGSVCSNCDASDQALVSTWYNNYCSSGGTDTGANTNPPAAAAPSPSPSSSSDSSDSSASSSSSSSSSSSPTEQKKSWWSTHYQWVIMLIVLVVGFSALAAIGVWLKRRYDAKRPHLYHGGTEAGSSGGGGRGLLSPAPPPWGPSSDPSQSVASSSRTDVAPQAIPATGSQSRLQKPARSLADVEIRQVSRQ